MEKELKKKGVATFKGLSINSNRVVTLKFKIAGSEILTSVELLTGLNSDITVMAKLPSRKPRSLGLFTIGGISFDKDGNADIPFKGMLDNINLDAIQEVIKSEDESVMLMFRAVLELPGDNENEE